MNIVVTLLASLTECTIHCNKIKQVKVNQGTQYDHLTVSPRLFSTGGCVLALTCILSFVSGLLCTATADTCLSSPCNNGGTCLDNLKEYVCLCPKSPVWYVGNHCDELYDACTRAPCANCTGILGTDKFTCHCPDGLTGSNCTQDVDECESNPCKGPRSHCLNGVNGYSCHCPVGFAGKSCQDNVSTCSEETCQNGGTCTDILDTGHRCHCAPGYQGRNCEDNINECLSDPCQNGAICKDGVNGYQCFCVPGFQGYHCDLDINECASRPCQNNGTCVDEVDHYECECAPGFEGEICITFTGSFPTGNRSVCECSCGNRM